MCAHLCSVTEQIVNLRMISLRFGVFYFIFFFFLPIKYLHLIIMNLVRNMEHNIVPAINIFFLFFHSSLSRVCYALLVARCWIIIIIIIEPLAYSWSYKVISSNRLYPLFQWIRYSQCPHSQWIRCLLSQLKVKFMLVICNLHANKKCLVAIVWLKANENLSNQRCNRIFRSSLHLPAFLTAIDRL